MPEMASGVKQQPLPLGETDSQLPPLVVDAVAPKRTPSVVDKISCLYRRGGRLVCASHDLSIHNSTVASARPASTTSGKMAGLAVGFGPGQWQQGKMLPSTHLGAFRPS